jgi:hypothetical protein
MICRTYVFFANKFKENDRFFPPEINMMFSNISVTLISAQKTQHSVSYARITYTSAECQHSGDKVLFRKQPTCSFKPLSPLQDVREIFEGNIQA